jgi:hypothetical protein
MKLHFHRSKSGMTLNGKKLSRRDLEQLLTEHQNGGPTAFISYAKHLAKRR